jgi:hypothetical protein
MRASTSASHSWGIDVIQFGGLDQGVHHGRPLAATVGAGEQPRFTAERDAAQFSFGSIVGQANASIDEEAGEAVPPLERWRGRRRPIAIGSREPRRKDNLLRLRKT